MNSCLRRSWLWASRPVTHLHIFTVTKQSCIHSSLDIVLCLPLHVHNCVENILKHVLFYLHDINVMAKEIGLPIRKLLKNTSLYSIVGETKTRKLLHTRLKTKHNVTILQHHVIKFFTQKKQRFNITFNSAKKKSFLFFLNL